MKNISLKIRFSVIFISACMFASLGCGDQPLFDELATNRVKVIIKGTYESNSPRGWQGSYPADTDSIYVLPSADSVDVDPTLFMLDIAGIKVASGEQSQYFANYRKTYSSAINDTDPFFNGEGVYYKNNDMRPNFTWPTLQVYIRKMLFNSAKQYIPDSVNSWIAPLYIERWNADPDGEDVQDMFEERTVNAFNFNLAQVLSYYDSLKSNYADINRIFPLVIPVEDGFIFDKNDPETVLEIRLVIKNFVKKYEYEYTDSLDSSRKLRHFYALSDWLRNVLRDEPAPTTDTLGKMGGNLLAVARSYVPGKTATIRSLASTIASNHSYVIAIKSNHLFSEYNFARPTRPLNSGSSACDQPKTPRLPLNPSGAFSDAYMQALLDYYLQYEVYKQYYDYFVGNVNSGLRDINWDNNYEDIVGTFKIPQLVTYSDTGSYEFTNVPKGIYTIYCSTSDIPAGELPDSSTANRFNTTPLGTATVTEADYGQIVDVVP